MLLQLLHFMLIFGTFLISNKNYEDKLKTLSRTDSLTGLFNRKAFDQLANMQLKKQKEIKSLYVSLKFVCTLFPKRED